VTEILQLIILWVVVLGMLAGCVALAVFYLWKYWGGVKKGLEVVAFVALGVLGAVVMFGIAGGLGAWLDRNDIKELEDRMDDYCVHNHPQHANIASNKAIMVKQASAANVNFDHFNRLIEAATARIEKLEKVMPLTLNMSTLSNRAVLVETQK